MQFVYYFAYPFIDEFQLDNFITSRTQHADGPGGGGGGDNVILVTEGPSTVRQILLPELCKKSLMHEPPYWMMQYLDVRKIYKKLFNNNAKLSTLNDIMSG